MKIKKYSKIFIKVWVVIGVILPAIFMLNYKPAVKNYMVVSAFANVNKSIMKQYQDMLSGVDKIDLTKHTSKIKLREIKVDKLIKTSNDLKKFEKKISALKAFGVKVDITPITGTTDKVQREVNKVNEDIRKIKKEVIDATQAELQKAIKSELNKIANKEIQKQTGLSGNNYQNFVKKNYGIITEQGRNNSASIYKGLMKAKSSVIKTINDTVNKYYTFIFIVVFFLVIIVIGIFPIMMVGKYTKPITVCPKCKHEFITKVSMMNFLKFWKVFK